jgi:hypothetical protein
VVTQSRHAVEVQDPCRLLRHLELLIGTSRYSEQIEEQQQQLLALAQQMDVLQQEISRWGPKNTHVGVVPPLPAGRYVMPHVECL